jgi:hypothetical protein
MPQCIESTCVSTQAPAHWATGQLPSVHMLFAQICPVTHCWPQPPQWSELLAGSAQTPPQSIWGGVQTALHIPPTHPWPTLQTVPHAPQFCGSVAVLAMHGLPSPSESPVSLLEQAASE